MTYRSSPTQSDSNETLLPPNTFYNTDDGFASRRAMSVMSSSSYQYTVTEEEEGSFDNGSVRSAPPLPDNNSLHLSKKDLATSLESYEELLSAAKAYREQMTQLSSAAANFGYALEKVARGKSASDAAQGLQAAAGLQFLISNHQQILSDMFIKSFEDPLKENLEQHKTAVQQSQENYEAALKVMSKKIRETEANNVKNGRKGRRDIHQFRKALQSLTRQVDELDRMESGYHRYMVEMERKNHHYILGKVANIVRAQVDIYERISNKGLADPMLEQMMHQNPDPFCAYSTTSEETPEIFTVLPPVSLINPPQTPFSDHNNIAFDDFIASGTATLASTQHYPCMTEQRREEWQEKPPKIVTSDDDDRASLASSERVCKETSVGDEAITTTTSTSS